MTRAAARYQPRPEVFPSDLRALFRQLARWAVLSSFGASALGCASSRDATNGAGMGGSGGDDVAGMGGGSDAPGAWQQPACPDSAGLRLVDINAPSEIDYIAGLRSFHEDPESGTGALNWSIQFEYGARCRNASDRTACQAEAAELLAQTATSEPAVLVTHGDELTLVSKPEDLRELVGSIDTHDEAMLAAFLAGLTVQCRYEEEGTQVRTSPTGFEVETQWDECSGSVMLQRAEVSEDGEVTLAPATDVRPSLCVVGRRPEGLLSAKAARTAGLGAFFASAARLEAASVIAFDRLARELTALGAPETLITCALRSALEEIRHTQIVSALAQRFGGAYEPPAMSDEQPRSRLAFALENAVEGCVRETFGALVAWHQAGSARDPHVRAAMQVIAQDETRHAELSWSIARWLHPQLEPSERALIARAREAAFAELMRDPAYDLSTAQRALIGWPEPEIAQALIARLQSQPLA